MFKRNNMVRPKGLKSSEFKKRIAIALASM
jgi:hypothetical protein